MERRAETRELEVVRAELRRLGYLSDRFDRFLLQDALRPRGAGRALAALALRVGLLAGVGVALVLVLALAVANGLVATSPFDLAALFAHVAMPIVAVSALAFLLLAGLLAVLLRLYPARRIESLSLGVALAAGAGVAALALARLGETAGGPGGGRSRSARPSSPRSSSPGWSGWSTPGCSPWRSG